MIAPKSEDIKQGATGLPHHILFPKSQLLQFVESKAQQNNTQHANQLNNAFRSCRDDIKRANHNEGMSYVKIICINFISILFNV